jgi:hypothetical protein
MGAFRGRCRANEYLEGDSPPMGKPEKMPPSGQQRFAEPACEDRGAIALVAVLPGWLEIYLYGCGLTGWGTVALPLSLGDNVG